MKKFLSIFRSGAFALLLAVALVSCNKSGSHSDNAFRNRLAGCRSAVDVRFSGTSTALERVGAEPSLVVPKNAGFSDISYSEDFDADLLMISNPFLGRHNPEMIWATKGYMYIKEHPVFHLDPDELEIIDTDFKQFFQRIRAPRTLFGEEIVGSLLGILLYDMWNIYSREIEKAEIEDITSRHFLRFLMSVQEHCREQREVAWYARELGLAPKYLSEISKSITGRPAGAWIDSYAAHELQKLLSDQHLTLTDIVDAMHFSSQPALTRYMKRLMNTTPSEFRHRTFHPK